MVGHSGGCLAYGDDPAHDRSHAGDDVRNKFYPVRVDTGQLRHLDISAYCEYLPSVFCIFKQIPHDNVSD